MRACSQKIHSCLHIVIGSLCLIIGLIGEQRFVRASDEPISVGSITMDPHTNHRRAVTLKGTARNIGIQNGSDTFGQTPVAKNLTSKTAQTLLRSGISSNATPLRHQFWQKKVHR